MNHPILISRHCPYRNFELLQTVCDGIIEIDFYAANQIFLSIVDSIVLDIKEDDLEVLFHILMLLFYLQRQGSSCLHISSIQSVTMWEQRDVLGNVLRPGYKFPDYASMHNILTAFISSSGTVQSVVYKESRLYSSRYYQYERQIIGAVKRRLIDREATLETDNTNENELLKVWEQVFSNSSSELTSQQCAILNALCRDFSIITGGAGTGKTFTIARLLAIAQLFSKILPSEILLLAPTGKAANRLQESINAELQKLSSIDDSLSDFAHFTSVKPQTVHKALKINPVTSHTPFDKGHQLDNKLVIVDECSMLDVATMAKLLGAIPETCKVVLVGDPYQLPSVNVGSLLAELVQCFPMSNDHSFNNVGDYLEFLHSNSKEPFNRDLCIKAVLDTNYRARGALNEVAKSILDSKASELITQKNGPFSFVDLDETFNESQLQNKIIDDYIVPRFKQIKEYSELKEAWQSLKDYAFLTPYRKGWCGVDSLNELVHARIFGSIEHRKLRKGTPIIIENNDYRLELFNGDIGLIWPDEKGNLKAWFSHLNESNEESAQSEVEYSTPSNMHFRGYSIHTLPRYALAYAMTIHKTQGSEYENVDVFLPKSDRLMLSNQLVYTAITRARNKVCVISRAKVLEEALEQNIIRASGILLQLK